MKLEHCALEVARGNGRPGFDTAPDGVIDRPALFCPWRTQHVVHHRLLRDVRVARMPDPERLLKTIDNADFPGGSFPAALVYYKGLVFLGTGGGDGNYRGRGYALKAATGDIAWTFWGPQAPTDFGGKSWEGDSWKIGGAAPWMSPAVDPELGLVYWTFGNPNPVTNGSTRGGTTSSPVPSSQWTR